MDTNNKTIQEEEMNNREQLEKHYKSLGYKYFGWVNDLGKAYTAAQESKDKQTHEIGRNLHLIACHDLKVYVLVDSGD